MAHILVIDDEPDIRMATVMALQTGGHVIVEADGGVTAMKLLKEQERTHALVDLIVCDVIMPGMTGYDVCQLVRLDPAFRDIPFIFLSAKRDTDERAEGMGIGADDYVGKPFAVQELLIRVNSALAKHRPGAIGRLSTDPMTQMTLAQCIDMVVRHGLSGKLTAHLKGSSSGTIFFEGGHAVHAKIDSRIGEAAVREILAATMVMYSFEAYEVTDQITIAMDISRLIKRAQ